jgi:glycosyltransferase involved in cell wall biosynthesis
MKLVVLGSDDRILVEGSRSNARMRRYAGLIDELHILVTCRRAGTNLRSGNLHLYPAAGRLGLARWFRLLRIGAAVCRQVRPDLISAQDPGAYGLAGYLLSRRYRIPLQVQVHTDVFSPHYARASWREWVRSWLAVFVLPRAACVRAASQRVADGIARRLGMPAWKITVLPIHTDLEEVRSARRQADTDERFRGFGFRMVSAGRFVEREKNFGLLLDVMVELVGEISRPLLVLVGDGPDRKLYEQSIHSHGLEGFVVVEPWRDDLPSFLKSFDLFVLPSNFEGFPRVCIEATAAGLPVVMTDVGSAGELFVNDVNAVVVPVGDAPAMARAIARLASDEKARRRLVRSAQEAVIRISHRSTAEYDQAYGRALEDCLRR